MNADRQLAWSRLILGALADGGIRDVIVSPGSRSTPLVLAAAGHPRLRCRPILDERSAAYFALGQIRASGRASLLICTSGTAPAHYLPAVIEASHLRLPLVVLSADRPPELQQRDAPQTIDQSRLFGGFVRHVLELGAARDARGREPSVAASIRRALAASLDPEPGPIHINACLRKPLEESAEFDATSPEPRVATRTHPARRLPADAALAAAASLLGKSSRVVAVAGPAPSWPSNRATEISGPLAKLGVPLVADATSQLRFARLGVGTLRLAHFGLLERAGLFGPENVPDLILQLGPGPCLSCGPAWREVPRIILTEHGWHDPEDAGLLHISGEVGASLEGLRRSIGELSLDGTWVRRLRAAEAMAAALVIEMLDSDDAPWSEAVAVRAVLRALGEGESVFLANSLPVREANFYAPEDAPALRVLHQRGTNGIEGHVAGAAGAASVSEGRVTLLVGDLALLHDAGSLALVPGLERPPRLVVLDNGGGRIFDELPLADHRDWRREFERYFIARQSASIADLCRAYGVEHVRAGSRDELNAALGSEGSAAAPLIEVRLPRDPRATREELVEALRARLADLSDG